MKIYLDIGHGAPSKNPGATYKGRTESADVIKLSRKVGELLAAQGIEVKYSRTESEDPSLSARCKDANSWGANYFVSVHRNAYQPNKAKGFEAWIFSKAATNGDAYNKAKKIVDAVCTACGFVNRGVKKGAPSYTDYAVNRDTNMTSVLIECGFVDSDADNAIFDGKFTEMATAIAKALCEIVGVTYKVDDKKYEVIVGGTMDKQHCEWVAERLRGKGETSVYIREVKK